MPPVLGCADTGGAGAGAGLGAGAGAGAGVVGAGVGLGAGGGAVVAQAARGSNRIRTSMILMDRERRSFDTYLSSCSPPHAGGM